MDAVEPRSRGIQIGVDIGQRIDPTAIVVAERQLRDYRYADSHRPIDQTTGGDIHYVIRHIKRMPLGTSYPAVVERLAEIYYQLAPRTVEQSPGYSGKAETFRQKFFNTRPTWHDKSVRDVLIDATGVGTPVVDLIKDKGIRCTAVYLTGGEKATAEHGELRLAKTLLVSRLQVLLQQRRIHMDENDAEAQATAEELLNYEIKVTDSQNLQMGVFKTGKHDDLATALGLACWEDDTRGVLIVGPALQALADWFGGIRGGNDPREWWGGE